jgi:hypothetical protein
MVFALYITLACSFIFSLIFWVIYNGIEGFTEAMLLATLDSAVVCLKDGYYRYLGDKPPSEVRLLYYFNN